MGTQSQEYQRFTSWHLLGAQRVLEQLEVDPEQGLTEVETEQRRNQYGANELTERGAKGPLVILWEQLTAPMVLILVFAAVVVRSVRYKG
jgi:Ca2+-transporting ATPase